MDHQHQQPLSLFYAYAYEDEALRVIFEKHLSQLQRQGIISTWYDGKILPGTPRAHQIETHLQTASIILLLISADFLHSDMCSEQVMRLALERHYRGEARVIPIILRPCDWQHPPLSDLQALPLHGKPLSLWSNRDEGWMNVIIGIRLAINEIIETKKSSDATLSTFQTVPPTHYPLPQKSQQRLTGSQRKAIMEALEKAYPSYRNLEHMLSLELDLTLAAITPLGGTYQDVLFALVRWAESRDCIPALIQAARNSNSSNRALIQLEQIFLANTSLPSYPITPPNQPSPQKNPTFHITNHQGVQGQIIGNNNTINQHFGPSPHQKESDQS